MFFEQPELLPLAIAFASLGIFVTAKLALLSYKSRGSKCPQEKNADQQDEDADGVQPICRSGASMDSNESGSVAYLLGGLSLEKGYLNDLWEFDAESHEWVRPTTTGSPPPPCGYSRLRVVGDRCFVFGGVLNGFQFINSLHVLDTQTKEWQKPVISGDAPAPRCAMSVCVWGDTLVIFGGLTDQYKHLSDVWLLDTRALPPSGYPQVDGAMCWQPLHPSLDKSFLPGDEAKTGEDDEADEGKGDDSSAESGPVGRRNHCAVVIGSDLLVFGGQAKTGVVDVGGGRVEVLSLELQQWRLESTVGDMPYIGSGVTCVVTGQQGVSAGCGDSTAKVLLMTKAAEAESVNELHILCPATMTWSQPRSPVWTALPSELSTNGSEALSSAPAGRRMHSAAMIVFGGGADEKKGVEEEGEEGSSSVGMRWRGKVIVGGKEKTVAERGVEEKGERQTRMLVFGGELEDESMLNDSWLLKI